MTPDRDLYDRGIQISGDILDKRTQSVINFLFVGLGTGATASLAAIVTSLENNARYPVAFVVALAAFLIGLHRAYSILLQQRHRAHTESTLQAYYPAIGAFIDEQKFRTMVPSSINAIGHDVIDFVYRTHSSGLGINAIYAGKMLRPVANPNQFETLLKSALKLRDLRTQLDEQLGKGVDKLRKYLSWVAGLSVAMLLLLASWPNFRSVLLYLPSTTEKPVSWPKSATQARN